MTQFAQLLNSSRFAIEDFCAFNNISQIPIMIHIPADSWTSHEWFFDSLFYLGVSCDIIGLSYYPKWHGQIASLEMILNNSAAKYHKQLIVVETSYLYGLYWENPDGGYWGEEDLLDEYPATPDGQKAFFEEIIKTVLNVSDGLGRGVFLWEPAWIYPCVGTTIMQDRGLFNLEDVLLDVYSNPLINVQSPSEPSTDSTSPATTDDSKNILSFPILGFLAIVGTVVLHLLKLQKKRPMRA
jgi:arabinogalactan endo-1,4-beta-galactosidase